MLKSYYKKWVFIATLIFFSLLIAIRSDIKFFYFFFWSLLSLVVISFVWLLAEYFGTAIRFKRQLPYKIEEEDDLEIEATITNRGVLPVFDLVLIDNLACAEKSAQQRRLLINRLRAFSSEVVRYSCYCPLRGEFKLGPVTAYFFDPFGLFFLKKEIPAYSTVYVYPKPFEVKGFPLLQRGILPWFGISAGRASGDDDEVFGVREYKQGDPIKRIHWFSTARKNKLMVKQFQRQNFFRATILFNLEKEKNYGEGRDSVCEYTIKIVASVVQYFLQNDIAVEVIAHTGEIAHIPFNKGPEHQDHIFKFLACARPESTVGLSETFEEFSRYIPNNSNLIVVMVDKDWKYLMGMMSLEKRDISLIPIILVSSTFMYKIEQQDIIREVKLKLSGAFSFTPIFCSRGDNLSNMFIRSNV
jgi:uncharacterized protein (DUF58 family)